MMGVGERLGRHRLRIYSLTAYATTKVSTTSTALFAGAASAARPEIRTYDANYARFRSLPAAPGFVPSTQL